MYTVIINEKFIWSTFVSSILFCWSLMFPIAVIQRTSASTSFFIWKSKTKLTFPIKCIHFYNGARWLTIAFYAFIYHLLHGKQQSTEYNTRKKDWRHPFFFQLVEIRLKCVLMYQALWQIKTKEEAQKYMYTNLFFFPL